MTGDDQDHWGWRLPQDERADYGWGKRAATASCTLRGAAISTSLDLAKTRTLIPQSHKRHSCKGKQAELTI